MAKEGKAAKAPKESKRPESRWQSRIVGHGEMAPDEIVPHPENWRRHPIAQSEAMIGVLDEVGWVQDVVVNKNTNRLIDGHLRVELAQRYGEATVPVVFVDLSEEEERLILATMDPIGAMARQDEVRLQALLQKVQAKDAALKELTDSLAKTEKGKKNIESSVGLEEMEIMPYEHYDYIVLFFRDVRDFMTAAQVFGLKKTWVAVGGKTKRRVGIGRALDGVKALKRLGVKISEHADTEDTLPPEAPEDEGGEDADADGDAP